MKRYLLCIFLVVTCICLGSCLYEGEMPFLEANETLTTLNTEAADTPGEKAEYTKLSFIGAGDNIVYAGVVHDGRRMKLEGGRDFNFKPIYSEVESIIAGADIAYINQETLMCGEGYQYSYYPSFNGPQELGIDLVELGFDIIGIANNHMLDKGSAGLEKTIAFYDTLPVTMIGGYKNKADYENIRVHEKDGVKIALLSYTEWTNGIPPTRGYDTWIPYLDEANIEKEVAAAKEKADLVFVVVHWGDEGAFKPNAYQQKYAKRFADSGVDVIIGTHPHVVQPVEWIEGKDGNKTLCYYSLGNFMAEQAFAYNMVGGMCSFDIVKANGEKPVIKNAKFIPTVFDWGYLFYENKVFLLENYTAEQARNHGISAYGRYTSLEQLRGYISNTIADEFLPESYLKALG